MALREVFRRCCPCRAAWLAALWFGVVCLGGLRPCVVACGGVLSCGGVLLCSAVCLRRCLCLLFLSCFKNHCQTRKKVFPFLLYLKIQIRRNPHTRAQQAHVSFLQLTCYPWLATLYSCCW